MNNGKKWKLKRFVQVLGFLFVLMLVLSPNLILAREFSAGNDVAKHDQVFSRTVRNIRSAQEPLPLFDTLEIEVKDQGTIWSTYTIFRPQIYLPAFNHSRLTVDAKKDLLAAGFWVSRSQSPLGSPLGGDAVLAAWFNTSDDATAIAHGEEIITTVLGLPLDATSVTFTSRYQGVFPFSGFSLTSGTATFVLFSVQLPTIVPYFAMVEKGFLDNAKNNSIAQSYLDNFGAVDQVEFVLWRYGVQLDDLIQGIGARRISMADTVTGIHQLSVKSLFGLTGGIEVNADYLNVTIYLPRVNTATISSSPLPDFQEIVSSDERAFHVLDSPDDWYYRLFYSISSNDSVTDIAVSFEYTFHPRYLDDWSEIGIHVSPFGTATRRLVLRGENATLSKTLFDELRTNATYDAIRALEISNEYINNTLPDGSGYKIPFAPVSGFFFFSAHVYLDEKSDNMTVVESTARLLNRTLFNGSAILSISFKGSTVITVAGSDVPVVDYEIGVEGFFGMDQRYNLTNKLVNSPAWNMSELIRSASFNYKEKGYHGLSNNFYHVTGAFTNQDYWGAEFSLTWPIIDIFNGPTPYHIWPTGVREHQLIPETIFGFSDLNMSNSNIRGYTLSIIVPVEHEGASSLNVPLGTHDGYGATKGFFTARSIRESYPSLQSVMLHLYQAVFDVDLDFYWINVWKPTPSYNDSQGNIIPISQFSVNFNHTMVTPRDGLHLPLPYTIGFIGDRQTQSLITTSSHVGLNSRNNLTNIVYFGPFDYQFERFNGTETLLFLIQDDYGVYLNGTSVSYANDIFNLANNQLWNHWITSSGITNVSILFKIVGAPGDLGGNFILQDFTIDPFAYNGTDVIFYNHLYTWNGTSWRDTDPGVPPMIARAFKYTWNTTGLADGYWDVLVNVTNAQGRWSLSRFRLLVDNYQDGTTSPPTITILDDSDLKDGEIIRSTTPVLRFNITDDVGIFDAYITIDNQSFLLDYQNGAFTWDVTNTWEGQHVITLTALDMDGNNATLTLIVHVDKGADPIVRVLSPANNTILNQGESATLTVKATDDRGIADVTITIDDGVPEPLLSTDGENYTYVLDADTLGNGTHQLIIQVTDSDLYSHRVVIKWIIVVLISPTTTSPTTSAVPTTTTTTSSSPSSTSTTASQPPAASSSVPSSTTTPYLEPWLMVTILVGMGTMTTVRKRMKTRKRT